MQYPVICVDNFFNNPYEIVKFANSLPCEVAGQYPGRRTENLEITHVQFAKWISLKMLSVFFPNQYMKLKWASHITFQKIDPTQVDGGGWIHPDGDSELSALVYLNEENLGGTSIFKNKSIHNINNDLGEQNPILNKYEYFKDPKAFTKEEVDKCRQAMWKNFNEVTVFEGIFNRLVMYDGHEYHAQHVNPTDKTRLTLACFFKNIHITPDHWEELAAKPLESMRKI
jgi:hypothetical protein